MYAEINDEPNFEHSSLTQTNCNPLTRSCDLKGEPVFSSLRQFFGEQLKALSHHQTPEHLPTSLGMGNKSKHRGAQVHCKCRIPPAEWPHRRPSTFLCLLKAAGTLMLRVKNFACTAQKNQLQRCLTQG